MAKKNKPDEKPVRVQFQHGVTSREILKGIKQVQDEWAKKFPERAHRLYPTVWDENGDRIKPAESQATE